MIATRAGWLDQHEVCEVWFDPAVTPFATLLAAATARGCARQVWTTTDAQAAAAPSAQRLVAAPRPDKEPKYYLLQTPWKHVPMTSRQACVVNALLRPGGPGVTGDAPLSLRQRDLFAAVKAQPGSAWPVVVDVPLAEAWSKVAAARAAFSAAAK